jgi:hypothetical protein
MCFDKALSADDQPIHCSTRIAFCLIFLQCGCLLDKTNGPVCPITGLRLGCLLKKTAISHGAAGLATRLARSGKEKFQVLFLVFPAVFEYGK